MLAQWVWNKTCLCWLAARGLSCRRSSVAAREAPWSLTGSLVCPAESSAPQALGASVSALGKPEQGSICVIAPSCHWRSRVEFHYTFSRARCRSCCRAPQAVCCVVRRSGLRAELGVPVARSLCAARCRIHALPGLAPPLMAGGSFSRVSLLVMVAALRRLHLPDVHHKNVLYEHSPSWVMGGLPSWQCRPLLSDLSGR